MKARTAHPHASVGDTRGFRSSGGHLRIVVDHTHEQGKEGTQCGFALAGLIQHILLGKWCVVVREKTNPLLLVASTCCVCVCVLGCMCATRGVVRT